MGGKGKRSQKFAVKFWGKENDVKLSQDRKCRSKTSCSSEYCLQVRDVMFDILSWRCLWDISSFH